jgi:hypothetical protein
LFRCIVLPCFLDDDDRCILSCAHFCCCCCLLLFLGLTLLLGSLTVITMLDPG